MSQSDHPQKLTSYADIQFWLRVPHLRFFEHFLAGFLDAEVGSDLMRCVPSCALSCFFQKQGFAIEPSHWVYYPY